MGTCRTLGFYFLLQGLFVLVELGLHVARWPRPLAHLWVVVIMLGTSPIFVGPLLWAITGHP
jgi:hypothetical protein